MHRNATAVYMDFCHVLHSLILEVLCKWTFILDITLTFYAKILKPGMAKDDLLPEIACVDTWSSLPLEYSSGTDRLI
jgi:hypothetical protein